MRTRLLRPAVLIVALFSRSGAGRARADQGSGHHRRVRGNDLVGYGLVVGLNGSGDNLRNTPCTEEMLAGILERLDVTGESLRSKNVAAVLVIASLPPFARAGSQIEVNVAAQQSPDPPAGSCCTR